MIPLLILRKMHISSRQQASVSASWRSPVKVKKTSTLYRYASLSMNDPIEGGCDLLGGAVLSTIILFVSLFLTTLLGAHVLSANEVAGPESIAGQIIVALAAGVASIAAALAALAAVVFVGYTLCRKIEIE